MIRNDYLQRISKPGEYFKEIPRPVVNGIPR